jgi:osmotically-inducible protein OsmY
MEAASGLTAAIREAQGKWKMEGNAGMDDKTLRQLIIDELDYEPSIDAANIGVAVEKEVVTLTGHVASYAEKIAAERIVQRIKGVKAIAQEIEVALPRPGKTFR